MQIEFTYLRQGNKPESIGPLQDIKYLGDRFAVLVFPDGSCKGVNLGNVEWFAVVPLIPAEEKSPSLIIP